MERTRIMTTNIPTQAKYADRVIVMENGLIAFNGPYSEAQKQPIFNVKIPTQTKSLEDNEEL